MPIGDDSYPYSISFRDGEVDVAVAVNATFAKLVLGCDGERRDDVQACVDGWRDALIEEALAQRSSWFALHGAPTQFACTLGLSGIESIDEGKSFPRVQAAVAARTGGSA